MRTLPSAGSEPVTVVDLFSGCGGFTQGFHEFRPATTINGAPVFRSIAAVERDESAAATYSANFGRLRPSDDLPATRVHVGDIEEWEPTPEALDADVVVGGPPCQGFSALNREKKGIERNRLWEEYVRIVRVIRPKVFVIENVDRFLKSEEFGNLQREVADDGLLKGYRLVDPPGLVASDTVEARNKRYLLNSADYGAVQARRRTIVIGVREDAEQGRFMAYPERTHQRRPRTSGDSLEFPEAQSNWWNSADGVFEESSRLALVDKNLPPRTEYVPEIGRRCPGVYRTSELHFGRNPEPLSLARYQAIPPGGNRKHLRGKWYTMDEVGNIVIFDTSSPAGVRTPVAYLSTPSWDNHNTGTGDVMGRMRKGEPSVTIRTEFYKPEKGRYLHPEDPRPITHFEAARIQGFPRDFRWCGSKVEIARQIGNAVPIRLGAAIAGAIHRFLRP